MLCCGLVLLFVIQFGWCLAIFCGEFCESLQLASISLWMILVLSISCLVLMHPGLVWLVDWLVLWCVPLQVCCVAAEWMSKWWCRLEHSWILWGRPMMVNGFDVAVIMHCRFGWCASHGGVAAGRSSYRSIHVTIFGCPYCIANTFHDFTLNCNGLLGFIETKCYSNACFEVELRFSHGLLLPSIGWLVVMLLCWFSD